MPSRSRRPVWVTVVAVIIVLALVAAIVGVATTVLAPEAMSGGSITAAV